MSNEDESRIEEKNKYIRPTIVLPFLDTNYNNAIKKICKKYGIIGNICFKTTTLYNLTKSQTSKDNSQDILEKKGVVYELICSKCKDKGKDTRYIGETGRKLKFRI